MLAVIYYYDAQFSIKMLICYFAIMAVSVFFKFFFFKERPNKQEYSNWLQKIDASSFPSVHSARAGALALLLGYFHANAYLLSLFLILAVGVCYSRIFLKKHDLTDVFFGALLGLVASGAILVF
jgi:membrane-associated phospholipid phosphatase